MAYHFDDPGQLVDDEWANDEDVLGPLRALDAAMAQCGHNLHAGRLSNSPSDPIAWENGDVKALYLHPFEGRLSVNRAEDGSYVLSQIDSVIAIDTTGYGSGLWDVFEHDEDGAVAIEMVRWVDSNTRGYTLVRSPILGFVHPTDPTRKWRGTVWTINDNISQNSGRQAIFNAFNRRLRAMFKQSATPSWFTSNGVWQYVPNLIGFTIISPFVGMTAHAAYRVGVSASPTAVCKIALATSKADIVYTRQAEARLGVGVTKNMHVGGQLAVDEGYYNIAPYEFATNTSFVGLTESGISALWEC